MLTAQLCMHAQAHVPSTVRIGTIYRQSSAPSCLAHHHHCRGELCSCFPAGALKHPHQHRRGSETTTAHNFFLLDEDDRGTGSAKDARSIFCYRPSCLLLRRPIRCARQAVMVD